MAQTEAATSRSDERRERRKAQILDAARACVLKEGFHVTSMHRIADEAGMSAGHIYRYFENKEAVMIALAERDFDEFMVHVTQLRNEGRRSVDTIVKAFLDKLPFALERSSGVLALEIYAEATRNPKVEELVLRVDRKFRDDLRSIVAPVLQGLTAYEIEVRVEMLLVKARALAVHAGVHRVCDVQIIADGFEQFLRSVLSTKKRPPSGGKGTRKAPHDQDRSRS